MTTLGLKLRYRKRLLWALLALFVASALWVLQVEIAYQRNTRHVPTRFWMRTYERPYNWKA